MEQIELVIRMPKDVYEDCKRGLDLCGVVDLIKDGTLLPKGHGRLIDGNRLKERIESEAVYADEQGKHDISDIFYRCGGMINTAYTMVEADKEGTEDA